MMPTDFAFETRTLLSKVPDETGIRSDGTGLFRLALVESACDFTLESAGLFGRGIVSCGGGFRGESVPAARRPAACRYSSRGAN